MGGLTDIAGLALTLAAIAGVFAYLVVHSRRQHQAIHRQRAQVVSALSHDMRTPLTGLHWSIETLLKGRLDEKQRRSVEIMRNITVELEERIESMLQFSNMETGESKPFVMRQEDLRRLITDVIEAKRDTAKQRDIVVQLTDSWPATLPLECDNRRMRLAFGNLIGNAIKFSKQGGVVEVAYQHTPEGHVISITDTGIGIPLDEQQQIFQGFYRASNANAQNVSGVGMGLMLSRAIIGQHAGTLNLQSQPDKGTVVQIILPDAVTIATGDSASTAAEKPAS